MTGSNSVNVFLGLGLPWVIAAVWAHSTNSVNPVTGEVGYYVPRGCALAHLLWYPVTSVAVARVRRSDVMYRYYLYQGRAVAVGERAYLLIYRVPVAEKLRSGVPGIRWRYSVLSPRSASRACSSDVSSSEGSWEARRAAPAYPASSSYRYGWSTLLCPYSSAVRSFPSGVMVASPSA
eukprot:SAG25_NODE_1242_length_3516_cov_1.903131_2_plen_178_part_00